MSMLVTVPVSMAASVALGHVFAEYVERRFWNSSGNPVIARIPISVSSKLVPEPSTRPAVV